MASYRKRPNGWEYRISYKAPDGSYKQKSKSGFRTKTDAKQAAAQEETTLKIGVSANDKVTFADYFRQWAELYKKDTVTLTTWSKYEYTLSKINLYFKNRKLSQITANDYQAVIKKFSKSYSYQTVKMFNTHVRQCLKMAIFEEIISKDFTAFATLPKKKQDEQTNFLELSEYRKLLNNTGTSISHKSHFFIYLIAVTGLRFSEAQGLTLADVDRNNMTISINKTYKVYGKNKGYQPTKNPYSMREVPISYHTLELIDMYCEKFEVTDRIFENLSNTAVNKTLKKLIGRNVHVHSLRHTYVSYLISEGIDLFAISKLIGHKDLNTTLSVYAHLLEESKNKNNKKIIELFGANLGQKNKNS